MNCETNFAFTDQEITGDKVKNLDSIIKSNLAKTLKKKPDAVEQLNMDEDLMYGYGLTSLDMIMLMSSICTDAEISLTELAEDDLGKIRTTRDIEALLATKISA